MRSFHRDFFIAFVSLLAAKNIFPKLCNLPMNTQKDF
jgi:hypothetical protein